MVLLALFGLYIVIGILFCIAFLWKGINTIDENANGSHWTFKAFTIPGTIALWPVLLSTWLKTNKDQ